MIDPVPLVSFAVTSLIIILVPGSDVFLLLRVSVSEGVVAGLRALAGIHLGNVIQAAMMISGIGLIISRIPGALTALKLVGAAYLLYLAVSSLRAVLRPSNGPGETSDKQEAGAQRLSSPFLQGLLANVTNPKVLIFFVAFFPQFLGNAGSVSIQLLVLSVIFISLAVIWEGIIVVGAGRLGRMMNSVRFTKVMDAACTTAFTGLAVALLVGVA
ncbi:LysE family translocator [Nocardia sp. NPDC059236]|uniref:LysE family translocator n=1 Tax=Nocardia sp. NPDC059236 TaxID=3346783 RepID=UPI0036CC8B99